MNNKEEILKKLNEVFCNVFDSPDLVITRETTAADIEDWDSLEHINLIAGCEKKFSMEFDLDEVEKMKNVGDMVEMIEAKQNA